MRKILLRSSTLLLGSIFLVLFLFSIKVYAANDIVKKVLIIHSYAEDYKWTSDVSKGITSVIRSDNDNIELNYAYMDMKKNRDKNYMETVYEFHKKKFQGNKFDAIICVDNDALDYLLKYGEDLFPNTPIVFTGINSLDKSELNGHKLYTGITEGTEVEDNIQNIMKLHSNLKNIVTVCDSSVTGMLQEKSIRELISKNNLKVNIQVLTDVSTDEFISKMKNYSKDTAILYMGQFRDKDGILLSYERGINVINSSINLPIYSCWDFLVGEGVVGGKVKSGFYDGKLAADMILKVLYDKEVDKIDIENSVQHKYVFDYEQLKRFNISQKSLPQNNQIINKPFAFFEQYKKLVLTIAGVIISLITFIIVLFVNIYERKISEKKLKESYLELSAVYEQLAAADEDLKSKYSELSKNKKLIKESEEKYKTLAYYDALTGLPNRTLFMNKLNEELCKTDNIKPGAVFFIDIDNFKKVNDSLGHQYGDAFLQKVAKELQKTAGEKNIVGRFGGDEFLILQPDINNYSDIKKLAKDIINIFKNSFEIDDKQIFSSSSIGITIYPQDGVESNVILKNVDTAMYKAKESGKNKYQFFDKKMFEDIVKKTEIEKELREALNRNELEVYYQPQINSKTEEISGLEALLRWKSEKFGFVSPAEFIPIAEETGLIIPIGKWVLSEACAQGKKWIEKGWKIGSIAVNISVIQLQHKGFTEMVFDTLENINLQYEVLEIEITESVLMESLEDNVSILQYLTLNGMKIALDDFGTGYSSLSYLRTLPIKTLKIDKSFIDNICVDENNASIVQGIIQLAHKSKLKVVAEGVETKEQVELLREMDCDYLQGYYFSKPLKAEEIEKFLLEKQ